MAHIPVGHQYRLMMPKQPALVARMLPRPWLGSLVPRATVSNLHKRFTSCQSTTKYVSLSSLAEVLLPTCFQVGVRQVWNCSSATPFTIARTVLSALGLPSLLNSVCDSASCPLLPTGITGASSGCWHRAHRSSCSATDCCSATSRQHRRHVDRATDIPPATCTTVV